MIVKYHASDAFVRQVANLTPYDEFNLDSQALEDAVLTLNKLIAQAQALPAASGASLPSSTDAQREMGSRPSVPDETSFDATRQSLADAQEDLEDDADQRVFEVEIGFFDMESDPRTAYDTMQILVACDDAKAAAKKAEAWCLANIPVVASVMIAATAEEGQEVDLADYT